jgi:hypothetical protein
MNGDKNVTATFAPRLTLAPATLPSGQVGTAYSTSLVPAGGIPPYTVVNIGALPRGLALAGTDISGTPTKTGLWTFTIRVRDDLGGKVTREYNLRIRKAAADMTPALNTAAAGADTRRNAQ